MKFELGDKVTFKRENCDIYKISEVSKNPQGDDIYLMINTVDGSQTQWWHGTYLVLVKSAEPQDTSLADWLDSLQLSS